MAKKWLICALLVLGIGTTAVCAQAQMPRPKKKTVLKSGNLYDIRKYLASASFTRTVTVDPDFGDFVTVEDAIAHVESKTPTEEAPWVIVVYGGDHDGEDATLPAFVSLLYQGGIDDEGDFAGFEVQAGAEHGMALKVKAQNSAVRAASVDGWGLEAFGGQGGVRAQAISGQTAAELSATGSGTAFTATSSEGPTAIFKRTEAAGGDANVLLLRRDSPGSNDVGGDLLRIEDVPGTVGAVTGDLIAARAGGGGLGAEAEKFAVSRTGEVRLKGGCKILTGSGSPEGVVAAPACSLFLRTPDGGASTTLYVKTNGTGNTGWTAK